MATVKFYLDKRRQKKDGTYPIKLNVFHNKQIMIATQLSASEKEWNGNEYSVRAQNYKPRNIVAQNSLFTPPAVLLAGYHNVISLVEPQRASMLVYVAIHFLISSSFQLSNYPKKQSLFHNLCVMQLRYLLSHCQVLQ